MSRTNAKEQLALLPASEAEHSSSWEPSGIGNMDSRERTGKRARAGTQRQPGHFGKGPPRSEGPGQSSPCTQAAAVAA